MYSSRLSVTQLSLAQWGWEEVQRGDEEQETKEGCNDNDNSLVLPSYHFFFAIHVAQLVLSFTCRRSYSYLCTEDRQILEMMNHSYEEQEGTHSCLHFFSKKPEVCWSKRAVQCPWLGRSSLCTASRQTADKGGGKGRMSFPFLFDWFWLRKVFWVSEIPVKIEHPATAKYDVTMYFSSVAETNNDNKHQ